MCKLLIILLLFTLSPYLTIKLNGQNLQNDWENSEIFRINKEEAHSTAIPFATFPAVFMAQLS